MNSLLTKLDTLNQKKLIFCIVAMSGLLAAWMQFIQHGRINSDAVLYLEQGRLFALGEWKAAFSVFNWPLYGACIGLISKVTTLGTLASAQLLSVIFFMVACSSYIAIIKLANGHNKTILMAALLLFGSQYIVGDALEMLIRGPGFWAFYLTAIVYFIKYANTQSIKYALLWQVSIIIATLFRVEAILYLLLLPLFFLFRFSLPLKKRIYSTLQLYTLCILAAIVITGILITNSDLTLANFGRLDEVFIPDLYQHLTNKLFAKAKTMSDVVLGSYLDEFSVIGLLLTFLYVVFYKTIFASGLITSASAILGFNQTRKTMHPLTRNILLAVCSIALLASLLIIIKVFILSQRYVLGLTWILMVFASFYLAALSSKIDKKSRILFFIACLILSLGLIKNVLPKRSGYNHVQNSVTWVLSHKASQESVFYSDPRMRFYAGEQFSGKWSDNWSKINNEIKSTTIQNYNYLVLDRSKKSATVEEKALTHLTNFKEIKRFYNRKKSRYISVYEKLN